MTPGPIYTRLTTTASSTPRPASEHGPALGLDPLLPGQIEREHLALLELYSHIHVLLSCRDYAGTRHKLGAMLVRLRDHIQHKNIRLYGLLAERHESDPVMLAIILGCQEQAAALVHTVSGLLFRTSESRLDDNNAEAFKTGLNTLGVELTHCIERDEALLFPLYRKALRSA